MYDIYINDRDKGKRVEKLEIHIRRGTDDSSSLNASAKFKKKEKVALLARCMCIVYVKRRNDLDGNLPLLPASLTLPSPEQQTASY